MSASDTLKRSYKVGKLQATWSLEFDYRCNAVRMECNWWPHQPARMSGKMLRQYRAARAEFNSLVAATLGGPVWTFEV